MISSETKITLSHGYIFFILIFLTCCKKTTDSDATFKKDTLHINEVPLIHHSQNDQRHSITLHGDTIIKFEDYHRELAYMDIDEDGYQDIRIEMENNSANQYDNYLFDKDSKIFRKVENSTFDIKKIKDTPYYYSITSAGCAGRNSESYLSKIVNWTQIYIGKAVIHNCDDKALDGIRIYKVTASGEMLLETLPLANFNDTENSKPAYLKDYWMKNFKRFEN